MKSNRLEKSPRSRGRDDVREGEKAGPIIEAGYALARRMICRFMGLM